MFKCDVCGTELPDGTLECTNCKVRQEPAAKFENGQLVKMYIGDEWYYNHIVDSYFNHEIKMRMYRLNENMAMPIYREDWLEAVTEDEIERIKASGKLKRGKRGGWQHPDDAPSVTEEAK